MEIIENIKESFRGREAWKTVNITIIFMVYAMFFAVLRYIPQYFWVMIVVISFILLIYGNFYQHKLREVAESSKGKRSVEGWTTHGYKSGEAHFYDPVRFEVKDKLSPAVLKEIEDFIKVLAEHGEDLKTKTGLERFRQKQISYNETVKGEEMKAAERLKIEKEEKDDYNNYMQEYNEMIKQKRSKITTNEEEKNNG